MNEGQRNIKYKEIEKKEIYWETKKQRRKKNMGDRKERKKIARQ